MIDTHMHIGRVSSGEPLTPEYVLDFMDANGIEKAVLLAIENPEETWFYVTTEEVLRAYKQHPDRFIPFCNIDPRRGWPGKTDFRGMLCEYKERGCRGFGEVLVGLPIDEPRLGEIFGICEELSMPVVLDMNHLCCGDELGMPRLERVLQTYPALDFIGHGPHFWAEISGDVCTGDFDGENPYPTGCVTSGGAVQRLLSQYPNMHADLSALSGYCALTRDMDYGYRFLNEFQDKLLFGTDLVYKGQEVKIVDYLKNAVASGRITVDAYEKITFKNAKKLLNEESREFTLTKASEYAVSAEVARR